MAVNASVKALESAKLFHMGSTAAQNDKEMSTLRKNLNRPLKVTQSLSLYKPMQAR